VKCIDLSLACALDLTGQFVISVAVLTCTESNSPHFVSCIHSGLRWPRIVYIRLATLTGLRGDH
jgi:hypothetical protein